MSRDAIGTGYAAVLSAMQDARPHPTSEPYTETHWGHRFTGPTGGHITDYGVREDDAREQMRYRVPDGCTVELITRTVSYGSWRAAG